MPTSSFAARPLGEATCGKPWIQASRRVLVCSRAALTGTGRSLVVVALGAALGLAGCEPREGTGDGSGPGAPPSGPAPGIASEGTPRLPDVPLLDSVPTWTPEAEVRIDGHAEALVPVGWLGVASDGTMVVFQGQAREIRFFDVDGRPAGSFGGEGRGPGEFQRLLRGGWIGDTLWIDDGRLQRLTYVSPSLELIRTDPPRQPARPGPADRGRLPTFPFIFPYGVLGGDTLLVRAIGSAGDPLAEALDGSPLLRMGTDGTIHEMILLPPPGEGTVPVSGDGWTGGISVPFYPDPHLAIAPDGRRIASVTTEMGPDGDGTIQVTVHDDRGAVVGRRVLGFRGEPIPPAEVDRVLRAREERAGRPEMKRAYRTEARRLVPGAYPPVWDVVMAADRRVWIGLRGSEGGTWWLVLADDGSPVAKVPLPPRTRVQAARDDRVWVTERDELDVESVIRFRLRPSSR